MANAVTPAGSTLSGRSKAVCIVSFALNTRFFVLNKNKLKISEVANFKFKALD
jgi:hypothetical protein